MNWYKFAKIQKKALKFDDLYDFYLITTITKEDFKYLFSVDEENKYYFARKLDEIKEEYVKGGIFAVNLEMRHIQSSEYKRIIETPQELVTEAAKAFMDCGIWPSEGYAGKSWALIAEKIYDLSKFPDLTEYVLQDPSDEALIHQIYNLIFKIDHINDICHNSGIALPKMMNEHYKDINIYSEYEKYRDVHSGLFDKTKEFLDFKRDEDIKDLIGFNIKNIDPRLLNSIREIGKKIRPTSLTIIKILDMLERNEISLNDIDASQIIDIITKMELKKYLGGYTQNSKKIISKIENLDIIKNFSDKEIIQIILNVFRKLSIYDISNLIYFIPELSQTNSNQISFWIYKTFSEEKMTDLILNKNKDIGDLLDIIKNISKNEEVIKIFNFDKINDKLEYFINSNLKNLPAINYSFIQNLNSAKENPKINQKLINKLIYLILKQINLKKTNSLHELTNKLAELTSMISTIEKVPKDAQSIINNVILNDIEKIDFSLASDNKNLNTVNIYTFVSYITKLEKFIPNISKAIYKFFNKLKNKIYTISDLKKADIFLYSLGSIIRACGFYLNSNDIFKNAFNDINKTFAKQIFENILPGINQNEAYYFYKNLREYNSTLINNNFSNSGIKELINEIDKN